MSALKKYSDLTTDLDELSRDVVDAIFQVHKNLGPGFPEKIYEAALCYEFEQRQLKYETQKSIKVVYPPNQILDPEYKLDMVVEDKIIIELKCVQTLLPVHEAQLYAYLKMSKIELGFLVNFYTATAKEGIKRYVFKNPS